MNYQLTLTYWILWFWPEIQIPRSNKHGSTKFYQNLANWEKVKRWVRTIGSMALKGLSCDCEMGNIMSKFFCSIDWVFALCFLKLPGKTVKKCIRKNVIFFTVARFIPSFPIYTKKTRGVTYSAVMPHIARIEYTDQHRAGWTRAIDLYVDRTMRIPWNESNFARTSRLHGHSMFQCVYGEFQLNSTTLWNWRLPQIGSNLFSA